MSTISFIDTSILCNLVPVPGFDQQKDGVSEELRRRLDDGEEFILPITSEKLLRLICAGQAPWVLHDVAWDRGFLQSFLDGADTATSFIDHAQAGVGAGDLCILTERQAFSERSRIPAGIWTLDGGLSAHA